MTFTPPIKQTAVIFGTTIKDCETIFHIIDTYHNELDLQDLMIEVHRHIPLMTYAHFLTVGYFIGYCSAAFKAEQNLINSQKLCQRQN